MSERRLLQVFPQILPGPGLAKVPVAVEIELMTLMTGADGTLHCVIAWNALGWSCNQDEPILTASMVNGISLNEWR